MRAQEPAGQAPRDSAARSQVGSSVRAASDRNPLTRRSGAAEVVIHRVGIGGETCTPDVRTAGTGRQGRQRKGRPRAGETRAAAATRFSPGTCDARSAPRGSEILVVARRSASDEGRSKRVGPGEARLAAGGMVILLATGQFRRPWTPLAACAMILLACFGEQAQRGISGHRRLVGGMISLSTAMRDRSGGRRWRRARPDRRRPGPTRCSGIFLLTATLARCQQQGMR